jgi:hypothetical protein
MLSVPLFWQSKYLDVQSDSAFFVGVNHDGAYEQSRHHADFRTWASVDSFGQSLRSPCRATFGGFWSVSDDTLEVDIAQTLDELRSRFPDQTLTFYLPAENATLFDVTTQKTVMERSGLVVDFIDRNFSIDVNSWDFSSLSKGNRKKFRQWKEVGGVVSRADGDALPTIYEVIRLNRLSLGVIPSISLEDLTKLSHNFFKEYEFYVASVDGCIAAVAVTIETVATSKYVFFWADALEFRHLSPTVAICEHLISVCREQHKTELDLGISTVRGDFNLGLMRFKRNLGASDFAKFQISSKL